MRRTLFHLPVLGALAAALVMAAPASAVTFGADLNKPANNTVTCAQGAPDQVFGGFKNQGQSSCMWSTGSISQSLYASANGTVNTVRVKVGNVGGGGQLQVMVLRSYYRNTTTPGRPEFAC